MAQRREQRQRYRRYRARKAQLPASHRKAVGAVERYALRTGAVAAQDVVPMLEALVEIFEQGVADGTTVSEVTRGDPVSFTEAFLRDHASSRRSWTGREQQRLAEAVARATTADLTRLEGAR